MRQVRAAEAGALGSASARRVSSFLRHMLPRRQLTPLRFSHSECSSKTLSYTTIYSATMYSDDPRCTELAYPDLVNFGVSV